MIRQIGLEGQRVLFGIDRNEAYDQGICIRCGTNADSPQGYLELESLCQTCWMQLNEICDHPVPITLSIQVGEHVGDCIAVPPELDGFTCLNALVRDRIPRDELKRLCEAANVDGSIIRLPKEANPQHTIFLAPKAHGSGYYERCRELAIMLKLFTEVCSPSANFESLLITRFSHEAPLPSLEPLRSIWQAIYNWHLFKEFGALKQIFIGAHPDAARQIASFIDGRSEFTSGIEAQPVIENPN